MPQSHWTEPVIEKATDELARAKDAMKAVLFRPVLRRPNTKDILMEAAVAPEALPADARERLMVMLKRRYGEQAVNVAPYILGEEPEV